MNNKEYQEFKARNKELVSKASAYTNLAYAMVEAADSIMLEANSMLRQVGAEIDRQERQKYNNVCRAGKQFKLWLKDLARVVYKIDVAGDALDTSDRICDIMLLIMDRCGGDEDTLTRLRAMIYNSFKSKYNYYDK